MQDKSEELFLLGLFSVLDVVLEKTMEDAMEMVMVAGDIRDALTHGKGPYATLYEFIQQYEKADWQEVSRQLLLADVSMESVHDAYMDALTWYKQLV